MLTARLLKPITLKVAKAAPKRWLAISAPSYSQKSKQIADFDPNNYVVPLRPATLDDLMEPYGSWKVAYAAEKKRGNRSLLIGIVSLTASITALIQSGVFDGAIMPNLDNVMEETEPFEFDKEGRITV